MGFDAIPYFKRGQRIRLGLVLLYFDWFSTSCGWSCFGNLIAEALISEGVSGIVFAISSSANGEFNWKGYAQHKIQSLTCDSLGWWHCSIL